VTPQPFIIPVKGKNGEVWYRLEEWFSYEWEAIGSKWKIILPKGFESDGASIPRFLWTVTGITPDGLHRAAAWIHDWLYLFKGSLPEWSFLRFENEAWVEVNQPWERIEADKLFANMLKQAEVSKFQRRIMYLAVRAFGGKYW
jgi:hypothetical protein